MSTRLILSALLLALSAGTALACPADLDASFGDGGIAPSQSIAPGLTVDVEVAADDSIVTAGVVDGKPALLRYTPDGALDESFGDGGLAQLDVEGIFSSLAFQDDGSIVAAGDVMLDDSPYAFGILVARFDTSGMLDADFGDGGLTISLVEPNLFSRDLLLRSDGTIVVTGQAGPGLGQWQPYAFFYTEDGDPDSTIGENGAVRIGSFASAVATSAVETDGLAIVVLGILPGGGESFLARLTGDGTLDASFGNDGIRVYPSPRKYEEAWRVGKDAAGRLYMSGNTTVAGRFNTKLFVRRVLPNGRRDRDYGAGGRAVIPFNQELSPRGLAVSDDGVATVPAWFLGRRGSFVARLTEDGERDTTFGRNGVARFRLGAGTQFHQVALQDDGAILATGAAGSKPLLLRLEGGDGPCTAGEAP